MDVVLRRIYAPPGPSDGWRVLVDRLWPRGLSKAGAGVDEWLREVAPSASLRQWFGHDVARWPEFSRRYRAELGAEPAATAVAHLLAVGAGGRLTLLYAARDEIHNNAWVLREHLLQAGSAGWIGCKPG